MWLIGTGHTPDGDSAPVELDASVLAEPNDFVADIRAAAQFARERWAYLEHRRSLSGVDVDELEKEALAMLGEHPSLADFQRAITFFVAGLKDGHAGVITQHYVAPGTYRWPFTLIEVAEGVMVDGVAEDAEAMARAAPPAIQRGDLLHAIDGRPIEEWIEEAQRFVPASTDDARRRRAIEYIARWDHAPERTFTFERTDGTRFESVAAGPRSFEKIEAPASLATTRSHRMLDGGVGYFRPGSFSPPPESAWPGPPEGRDAILAGIYAEFDRIIGELAGARALVLDLRGNSGGTDLLGQFLVDRLVEPGYTYFRLASLGAHGWRSATVSGSSAPEGENELRVPLVCLIDEYTFSTADNVAACLAEVHPKVAFVGRPNGAGTGAPRPFTLPRTRTRIDFCTQRVQAPSGRMAEGISIELDVPVTWTRDDVLQGRDPDLAAALRLLAH
jgi:hypothetical protein